MKVFHVQFVDEKLCSKFVKGYKSRISVQDIAKEAGRKAFHTFQQETCSFAKRRFQRPRTPIARMLTKSEGNQHPKLEKLASL